MEGNRVSGRLSTFVLVTFVFVVIIYDLIDFIFISFKKDTEVAVTL